MTLRVARDVAIEAVTFCTNFADLKSSRCVSKGFKYAVDMVSKRVLQQFALANVDHRTAFQRLMALENLLLKWRTRPEKIPEKNGSEARWLFVARENLVQLQRERLPRLNSLFDFAAVVSSTNFSGGLWSGLVTPKSYIHLTPEFFKGHPATQDLTQLILFQTKDIEMAADRCFESTVEALLHSNPHIENAKIERCLTGCALNAYKELFFQFLAYAKEHELKLDVGRLRQKSYQGLCLEIIEACDRLAPEIELREPDVTVLLRAAQKGRRIFRYFWSRMRNRDIMAYHLPAYGGIVHMAAAGNQTSLMEFLDHYPVSYGAVQGHMQGNQPIHEAALNGALEALEFLLDEDASPNVQNNRGYTPLMLAALRGHVELFWPLFEEGADADIETADGKSALSCFLVSPFLHSAEFDEIKEPLQMLLAHTNNWIKLKALLSCREKNFSLGVLWVVFKSLAQAQF